jgi:hypothetical protein
MILLLSQEHLILQNPTAIMDARLQLDLAGVPLTTAGQELSSVVLLEQREAC